MESAVQADGVKAQATELLRGLSHQTLPQCGHAEHTSERCPCCPRLCLSACPPPKNMCERIHVTMCMCMAALALAKSAGISVSSMIRARIGAYLCLWVSRRVGGELNLLLLLLLSWIRTWAVVVVYL